MTRTPQDAVRSQPLRIYKRDAMVSITLLVILLIPLVPRPTVGSSLRYVAPGVGVVLLLVSLLHWGARGGSGQFETGSRIPIVLLTVTAFYAGRAVFTDFESESEYAVSRVLMVMLIVCTYYLFSFDTSPEAAWRWFAIGCLPLASLVVAIGVTGNDFLGTAYPGRPLGITIPWSKTTGVPRSFGEQGIVVAVATSYMLGYWTQISRIMRVLLTGSLVVIVITGQSRNMYLSALVVLVVWFVFARRNRWSLMGYSLVVAGLSTFFVEVTLPLIAETGFGRSIIGEGIFERNIYTRFSIVHGAVDVISTNPIRVLVGIDHSDWTLFWLSRTGESVGLHNNIFASLLYLGVIGGAITLLVLYAIPAIRILRQLKNDALTPTDVTRRRVALTGLAGTLISINFYEGFFSLALALQVGLLWVLMVGRDLSTSTNFEDNAT